MFLFLQDEILEEEPEAKVWSQLMTFMRKLIVTDKAEGSDASEQQMVVGKIKRLWENEEGEIMCQLTSVRNKDKIVSSYVTSLMSYDFEKPVFILRFNLG